MKSANPAIITLAFQFAATSAAMIVVAAANVLSSVIASICASIGR
jgi:hypothetical protein